MSMILSKLVDKPLIEGFPHLNNSKFPQLYIYILKRLRERLIKSSNDKNQNNLSAYLMNLVPGRTQIDSD